MANLEAACNQLSISSHLGIAHTRWATHGAPNDVNAHPHVSADGSVAVVHNGIIENFVALRQALVAAGHKFVSETDTEVFAHLVADVRQRNPGLPLDSVVRLALQPVRGGDGTSRWWACCAGATRCARRCNSLARHYLPPYLRPCHNHPPSTHRRTALSSSLPLAGGGRIRRVLRLRQ